MLREDRSTHSLSGLYKRIRKDLTDRDMSGAFDEVYQVAMHQGVTDVYLDCKLHGSYLLGDDQPFIQHNRRSVIDGAEMTLDHAGRGGSLSLNTGEISEF